MLFFQPIIFLWITGWWKMSGKESPTYRHYLCTVYPRIQLRGNAVKVGLVQQAVLDKRNTFIKDGKLFNSFQLLKKTHPSYIPISESRCHRFQKIPRTWPRRTSDPKPPTLYHLCGDLELTLKKYIQSFEVNCRITKQIHILGGIHRMII